MLHNLFHDPFIIDCLFFVLMMTVIGLAAFFKAIAPPDDEPHQKRFDEED